MEGFDFSVEVSRTSRKKSASIELTGRGVTVTVPESLSDKRIRDLVTKRSAWIKSKLQEQSKQPGYRAREYVSGESFPYLGKNYRLKIRKDDQPSVKLKHGYLNVTLAEGASQEAIKNLVEAWYASHALNQLRGKTARLAREIGVSPGKIKVRTYKRRWGSCSSEGDISYNWRIILAPHRIVDYVVIHELCHLRRHDHSKKFWRLVKHYAPDYEHRRAWLKQHAVTLVL